MNRAIAIAAGVLALIATACVVIWLMMKNANIDNPAAEIYLNGELIKTVPLDESCEFTVECNGGYNTVIVENGSIRVSDADCPDKVCVNMGTISGGAAPIVCLPHRLEILVVNGDSSLDAVL